jgi:pyrroline-5-carboxylate reductase
MPEQPNIRIHADLFGPMLGADQKHAYILCITDAFTKYAVVMSIPNEEAETVARAIFGKLVLLIWHSSTSTHRWR